MREILFKAQAVATNEYINGYYYKYGINHFISTKYGNDELSFVVDEKTIKQWTGLIDRNANKIWEGDIVRFGDKIYTIIFENAGFALYDDSGLIISKIGGISDHTYPLQLLYTECCWEDNVASDIEVISGKLKRYSEEGE